MSLAGKIRALGWIVSLSGAGLLVFSGGFAPETRVRAMVGAVTMVVGMIITSLASLISVVQERRRLRQALEDRRSSHPSPPSPPG